jgi:phosphopantetheinyl transferase
VLAAAARRPIGVDVEGPIPSSALDGLAFAPEVRRRLEAAPPEARPRLRAEAWCTLEAVGKLRGVGLAAPFAELSPRGLTRVVGQARGGETWVAVHGDIERVHA